MYKELTKRTLTLLAPALECQPDSDTYVKLEYGINVFYINLLKSIVLIVVAMFLGILPYIVVFALTYAALRLFSFGIHLKTPFACTVLGLIYYIGGVYAALNLPISLPWHILIFLACLLLFFLYAPAQTKARPIKEKQYKSFKIRSILILLGIAAISCPLPRVYANLLLAATVAQTVNILPITYLVVDKKGKEASE